MLDLDRLEAIGKASCGDFTGPGELWSNWQAMIDEIRALQSAIRKHRDQRGDDRCWMDDEELYRVLPEGYVAPVRDTAVELDKCEQFIRCRHNPGTVYVSPEREIEELRSEIRRLNCVLELERKTDRDNWMRISASVESGKPPKPGGASLTPSEFKIILTPVEKESEKQP